MFSEAEWRQTVNSKLGRWPSACWRVSNNSSPFFFYHCGLSSTSRGFLAAKMQRRLLPAYECVLCPDYFCSPPQSAPSRPGNFPPHLTHARREPGPTVFTELFHPTASVGLDAARLLLPKCLMAFLKTLPSLLSWQLQRQSHPLTLPYPVLPRWDCLNPLPPSLSLSIPVSHFGDCPQAS